MGKRIDALKVDDNGPSSSSSSDFQMQTTYTANNLDVLAQELAGLGFEGAMSFILKYGYDRVKAAKDRAQSRPAGTIRNIAGYIRYLVTAKGPILPPESEQPKRDTFDYRAQNKAWLKLHAKGENDK